MSLVCREGLFRANETNNANKHKAKNPSWWETDQLAVYKCEGKELNSGETTPASGQIRAGLDFRFQVPEQLTSLTSKISHGFTSRDMSDNNCVTPKIYHVQTKK